MAVTVATDTTFSPALKENEKVVVKYFADWCGNCRLFAPKFKRLSNDERFADVTFLDVNAESSPEARQAAGVTNLPFFAVFKNGELVGSVASSKEDAVVELIEKVQ